MYLILQNKQGTGAIWATQNRLLASDGAAGDYFGRSVSISADGNTAIVGAFANDAIATDAGAAYVLIRSGGTWTEQQKLLASDGQSGDQFGRGVSISADGNTAIVGAYFEDTNGLNAGAAYIFTRSGGVWTEQQKLLASDGAADDQFGRLVSISGDGNTVIISAHKQDTNGIDAGAAYVFTRSGGVWTEQQKLLASDGEAGDFFSRSVTLSSDGNTAIASAHFEDTTATDAGAAYVFTRSGGVWTEQQKLLASDGQANARFGRHVSLSSDGNTAIISANGDTNANGNSAGAAYVFTRSGGTWTEQQKILASDGQANDLFGWSAGISGDGNTVIVGASGDDNQNGIDAGAAYIFTQSGGVWSQQKKLLASVWQTGDKFGISVGLNSNGTSAIVGAFYEDVAGNVQAGSAYVFDQ